MIPRKPLKDIIPAHAEIQIVIPAQVGIQILIVQAARLPEIPEE